MAKGYTTESKIETFLNETIATGAVDDAIEAAEKVIDRTTGRYSFIADASANARVFSGNGKQEMPIDDCVEISTVEWGSNEYGDSLTTIAATGVDRYYTLPLNNDDHSVPISALHLRTRYWTKGLSNHRITAKWGYSVDAPGDIVIAATIIAAYLYKYGRSGAAGGVSSEKIGEYSVSYKTQDELAEIKKAMGIIQSYVKYQL